MTNVARPTPFYVVQNPQPIARENPYTFFVPGADQLHEVGQGVSVRLMIAGTNPDRKYDAERMWVAVSERDGRRLTGILDNSPADIDGLNLGDQIDFKLSDIIEIHWDDPEMAERFSTDRAGWLTRCYADDAVVAGRVRVGYIYREAAEHGETDKYVDTGWRIRADVDELSDEEYENGGVSYVAIGAVLNQDDSFIELLGEPVGSAFQPAKKGTD